MIREYEVALLLSTELPEMNKTLVALRETINVYKAVQCFTDYTIHLVKTNRLHLVKDCFMLAEKMMKDGCSTVKMVVENVYVYSLGVTTDLLPGAGEKVRSLMTPSMKIVYTRHVLASGI